MCVCVCVCHINRKETQRKDIMVLQRGYINLNKIQFTVSLHYFIYSHLLTDCFAVSQLFSEARYVGRLELGSKPAQHYVKLSIRPLGQQLHHVGFGIIRYFISTAAATFVCLHFIPYRIQECSNRSKSFALCVRQPKIPSPEGSTPQQCLMMNERF